MTTGHDQQSLKAGESEIMPHLPRLVQSATQLLEQAQQHLQQQKPGQDIGEVEASAIQLVHFLEAAAMTISSPEQTCHQAPSRAGKAKTRDEPHNSCSLDQLLKTQLSLLRSSIPSPQVAHTSQPDT